MSHMDPNERGGLQGAALRAMREENLAERHKQWCALIRAEIRAGSGHIRLGAVPLLELLEAYGPTSYASDPLPTPTP